MLDVLDAIVPWAATPMLGVIAYYIRSAHKGDSHPTLSTWVLFSGIISLSALTYHVGGDTARVGYIAYGLDLALVLAISVSLLFFMPEGIQGRYRLRWSEFRPVDQLCFKISGCILLLWVALMLLGSSEAFATYTTYGANLSIQVVMLVAALPTFTTLWKWEETKGPRDPVNPESLVVWLTLLPIQVLYFTVGTMKWWIEGLSWLNVVYTGRGVGVVAIVIVLQLRLLVRANPKIKYDLFIAWTLVWMIALAVALAWSALTIFAPEPLSKLYGALN